MESKQESYKFYMEEEIRSTWKTDKSRLVFRCVMLPNIEIHSITLINKAV